MFSRLKLIIRPKRYTTTVLQLIVSKQGIPIATGMTAATVHGVKYLGMLDFDEQLSYYELVVDKGNLLLGYQTYLLAKQKLNSLHLFSVI